jgi:FkbM family methyltransferase
MHFVQKAAKRVLSPLLREKWKQYIKAELFHVPDVEGSLRRMKRLGFAPAAAIDVGAYVGDWSRSFKHIFPDTFVLMIEPQQSKRARLEAVAAEFPHVELRCALLGAEAQGNVRFHELETASSVLEESVNKHAATIYLPMTTLDAITQGTPFAAPSFLKLDVQGYELEILKGGTNTLQSVEAVLMEVNLLALHDGAPLFHESAEYMGQLGFQVYDLCGFVRRPYDDALWQADVIFVRHSSRLVSSSRWC